MHRMLAASAGLALAACATAPGPSVPREGEIQGNCDDAPAQSHIGHRASAAAGATLLKITGARVLRWVPPRTAVTMDFRPDRLTVSYNDNYVIERISCG